MSTILECIRTVGRGERGRKPLSYDQARLVMDEYLSGQCDDDQMAMLLMLIRVQNETKEEIAGFVRAFQERVPKIDADIDWPCYAGKRLSAGKPWHLLAAKLLAKQGYKVLLHGYCDGDSNREHAEHYLNALQIPRADSAEQARQLLDQHNIAYLALADFAPQAQTMIGWRARYGLRTPINTVVRALNPGNARIGLRGSFHPGFQQLHAEVESLLGQRSESVVSFKGQSGESEYNPKVSQTVWISHNGRVDEQYIEELMENELPMAPDCPFDTPEAERNMMAHTVVATMAIVLLAELGNFASAYQQAETLWRDYCAGKRLA